MPRYVRDVSKPEPGFYLIRIVKGGVRVPARICRDERGWWAEIRGVVQGKPNPDPLRAEKVMHVWLTSAEKPITEAEYHDRIRLLAHPNAPSTTDTAPLANMPPLF